ncbi:MAG: MFS transporter [Litorilinea sp.]
MLTNYIGIIRTFNRNIILYLVATGILGFAVDGGVNSVIFNLYLLRLGFGPEFIGQINSAGLTTFALASLPAGALAGRFPARTLMAIGLGLMLAGCAMLPLAESLGPANPAPWLFAGFIAIYLGMALYFVPAVPFIFDVTREDERSPVFSAQSALLALSAFIGSLIGGFLPTVFANVLGLSLDHPEAYRYTHIVATLLMAPALIAILKTRAVQQPEPPLEPQEVPLPVEATAPLQRRWRGIQASAVTLVILLSLVRFFQVAGVGSTATFFNVYMDTELGIPTATIGAVTATARLIGVPAALITPLLVMRWGARSTVAFAGIGSALSIVPLVLATGWGMAGVGYMGMIAFSSMRYPAFLGYSMSKVPARWRGTLSGAGEMAGGLSFAGIALVGGYIIANRGFNTLFMLGGALSLFGTFLFWIWFMRPREEIPPPRPVAPKP